MEEGKDRMGRREVRGRRDERDKEGEEDRKRRVQGERHGLCTGEAGGRREWSAHLPSFHLH